MISIAHAQTYGSYSTAELQALDLVDKVNQVILFPLIGLLMAVAFLVFLWGAFEYVKNSDNQAARETGRNHLLYGTIGMLVMLSAWAILSIAAGTFGLQGQLRDSSSEGLSPFAPDSTVRPPSRPGGMDTGAPDGMDTGAPDGLYTDAP